MKKMKLVICCISLLLLVLSCEKSENITINENIKKIEFTGMLVTYKAYFHNVLEYEKPAGVGVIHWFEKDRKLFAEYTGTVKLGIDLSKVIISNEGNSIKVFVPKATIIGNPNVDKEDFKAENFIESKEGINKNKITIDDATKAFELAQENIKETVKNDSELLGIAQKRAKVLIEENIRQIINIDSDKYVIDWEYEK